MARNAAAAPPPPPAARSISLQGWDTANMVTMDVLNTAIKTQHTTPKTFNATNKFNGTVSGTWGDWETIADPAADGAVVRMQCPIIAGSATDVTGGKYNLAGAVCYITVRLEAVEDASVTLKDKTAAPASTGKVNVIRPLTAPAGPATPAVTVDAVTPASLAAPFQFLFQDWFNANIGSFQQVFHTCVVNEIADKDAFQWLKPTHLSYASVTNLATQGFFAALCQTDGDPWSTNAHQIDVGIGENLPAGTNSVFAISGEKFVEKFLVPGAVATMQGSKPGDFDIVGNGLKVTNNKELVWQTMQLQDGTFVSPTVAKGGMSMEVEGDQIMLTFIGITFKHPKMFGNDIVDINFKQSVNIYLKKRSDGKLVLTTSNNAPDQVGKLETPTIIDPQINVTPDKTSIQADRILTLVSIGASLLSLGVFAAGKWAVWGAESANAASEVANAVAAADSVVNVAMDGAEVSNALNASVAEGNLAAAAAFTSSGVPMLANYTTFMTRFAQATAILSALTGLAVAIDKMTDIKGELDPNKMPALDDFMDNALGVSAWPNVSAWELKDARLAQSLLLYGEFS